MNPLRRLVQWLLPADVRDAVLADLDTEYLTSIQPARDDLSARWWYWRQLVGSIGPALAMRRRRRAHSGKSLHHRLRRIWARHARTFGSPAACWPGTGRSAPRPSPRSRLESARRPRSSACVDAILLRPLPYAEPSRLVRIWSANPRGIPRNMMSPGDFFDLRDTANGFDALAAFTTGETFTLSSAGDATRIAGSTVTPALFDLLGVRPLASRVVARRAPGGRVPVAAVARCRDARQGRLVDIAHDDDRRQPHRRAGAGAAHSKRSWRSAALWCAIHVRGLTLIGVYGVVAGRVSESTRELGIRMALGAHAPAVMAEVLRRMVGVAAAGVLCGGAAAWAAVPALGGMLYGVGARDLSTMSGAAVLVLAGALLAAYVLAHRILRLDVINALRVD
jgi:hypothetical protein